MSNNGYELGLTLTVLDGAQPFARVDDDVQLLAQQEPRCSTCGGVQQIFANSVNSDLKLLGSLIQVGQPLGVFYGYKTNGILRDSAAAAAYTAKVKPLSRHDAGIPATS